MNKSNNTLSTVFLVLAIIAGMGVLIYSFVGKKPKVETLVEKPLTLDSLVVSLPGSYSAKLSAGGVTSEEPCIAVLDYREDMGYFNVVILSQYDPENHMVTFDGTKVVSGTLGDGTYSYRADIDKTTLTFTKEDTTWVFTK